MATTVSHFVSVEVQDVVETVLRGGFFAPSGIGAFIAELRMKTIVDVASEVLGSMEQRANANKYAAGEPFGAVIAIRRTCVRRSVVITIRTNRRWAHLTADLSRG